MQRKMIFLRLHFIIGLKKLFIYILSEAIRNKNDKVAELLINNGIDVSYEVDFKVRLHFFLVYLIIILNSSII